MSNLQQLIIIKFIIKYRSLLHVVKHDETEK